MIEDKVNRVLGTSKNKKPNAKAIDFAKIVATVSPWNLDSPEENRTPWEFIRNCKEVIRHHITDDYAQVTAFQMILNKCQFTKGRGQILAKNQNTYTTYNKAATYFIKSFWSVKKQEKWTKKFDKVKYVNKEQSASLEIFAQQWFNLMSETRSYKRVPTHRLIHQIFSKLPKALQERLGGPKITTFDKLMEVIHENDQEEDCKTKKNSNAEKSEKSEKSDKKNSKPKHGGKFFDKKKSLKKTSTVALVKKEKVSDKDSETDSSTSSATDSSSSLSSSSSSLSSSRAKNRRTTRRSRLNLQH